MTADFAFEPATVTVDSGQTVTWTNADAVDHTVTAYEAGIPEGAAYFASGDFPSELEARNHLNRGLVGPGEEYEHVFERPGTYEYFCIPHERSGMGGAVQVE